MNFEHIHPLHDTRMHAHMCAHVCACTHTPICYLYMRGCGHCQATFLKKKTDSFP